MAIVGGESGYNARPIDYKWIIDLQKQFQKADVLFFFKQWGKAGFNVNANDPTIHASHPQYAKGGCQLNGKIYRAMPPRDKQTIKLAA